MKKEKSLGLHSFQVLVKVEDVLGFIREIAKLEICFFFSFISHSALDWVLQLFGNHHDFSSSWVFLSSLSLGD